MSDKLWNAFKKASDRSVLFIIKPNSNHKFRQSFLKNACVVLYILNLTQIGINIIQHEEGIVIAVINSIFVLMAIIIITIIKELTENKSYINEIISWFTEPNWKKFPKILCTDDDGNSFIFVRQISIWLILFSIKFYDFTTYVGCLGCAAVMQLIPSLRYQLPLPYHLPVKNWRNWTAFSISLTLEFFVTITMSQVIGFVVSFLCVFFLHTNEYLNVVLRVIERFNKRIVDDDENLDIDKNLREISKMITNCIRIMALFAKIMSNIVLGVELMSFFAIFTNAFIFLIVQQTEHYFVGTAVLILNGIALCFAFVNDKLKEKVNAVSYALYDLPWYDMSPKQREFLQFSIKCSDINVSFNCANVHEFNLEQFGNITKQAYSNALYLKKMLEKNMK